MENRQCKWLQYACVFAQLWLISGDNIHSSSQLCKMSIMHIWYSYKNLIIFSSYNGDIDVSHNFSQFWILFLTKAWGWYDACLM